MKIAVIIVTYNGLNWYDRCFLSLKKSTVPLDIIVIDNASTDDTIPYIEENYPEIYLIRSKINLGFGKANNLGIEYALKNNSEYIFLLNQDAWIFPDTIEKLLEVGKTHGEYGIVSPIHLTEDERTPEENFLFYLKSIRSKKNNVTIEDIIEGRSPEDIYSIDFVNAALWLISKECLKKTGGFNPVYFHYGEDDDYVNRVLYHGYKVGICPGSRAVHAHKKQKRLSVSERKKKKKHYGPWLTSYLRYLTNINNSFAYSLGQSFYLFSRKLVQHIFQLNSLSIYYDFKVAGEAISCIPQIVKNRNIAKHKEYPFLNLKDTTK
ncbi:MAG: glycosyltransferase family 2 protein [Flavobacteriaceae bacterium]|nr:glycosyltransferase family 2 protein [Flavobacteriaceae bacterium]